MGSPSNITFSVPVACYDGKFRTAYPQGDYPLPAPAGLSTPAVSSTTITAQLASLPTWVQNVEWSIKRASDSVWTVAGHQRMETFTFTELVPGTAYQLRARFQYLTFYSGYSPVAAATTNTAGLPIAPTISGPTRINATTLRIGISGGSGASSWTAQYRTPAGSGSFTNAGPVMVGAPDYDFPVIEDAQYDLRIVATNTSGSVDSNTVTGSTATTDVYPFPLPPGRAMLEANMPMRIVFPRPHNEMASYERPRLHPNGIPLRLPVGVQGGQAPFRFSISSNMPGLEIGADLPVDWFDNGLGLYGLITHPNPPLGTYSITITVTDQSNTSPPPVMFSMVVADRNDTTKFRWYDNDNGSNTNPGTFDQPYKDDSRLAWGTSSTSTTLQGQVWYKPSTIPYPLTAHSDLTDNKILLTRTTKPVVACGMPSAVSSKPNVTLSFNAARFNADDGGDGSGCFFGDMTWDGSVTSVGNFQNILLPDAQHRITFFEIDVTNIGVGYAAIDNPSFCFFGGSATSEAHYNRDIFFRGVREYGRPFASNSYGIVSAYGIRYVVFEDCRCINSTSTSDMYLKDSCRDTTIRYCQTDNVMAIGGQNRPGGITGDIEYVHSVIGRIGINRALTLAHEFENSTLGAAWVTRCTLVGYLGDTTRSTNGPFKITDTIIQTDRTPPLDITTPTPEVSGLLQGSGPFLDSNRKLTNAYAADRGIRGAEIFA